MTGGPQTIALNGAAGNRLVADVFGSKGPVALLLHGGGQTRHAWRKTAEQLAKEGWIACALDQRGHGDSEWIPDATYAFEDFGADVSEIARSLAERFGAKPAVIGASLGGIASLFAANGPDGNSPFAALVLVDITPRIDPDGVNKIQGFMRARAREGFDSIDEAAAEVAAYLPHRPRPRSTTGLRKNLRLHADGRWRWHWDPRFLDGPRPVGRHPGTEQALLEAARKLTIPTLLVRGQASELVSEVHVKEFLALAPHAEYVDVAGARHMVAGDQNDHFTSAIIPFLQRAVTCPATE